MEKKNMGGVGVGGKNSIGTIIEDNEIYNVGTGIDLQRMVDTKIEGNRIWNASHRPQERPLKLLVKIAIGLGITVIGGACVAYLVYRLGWNK